MWTIFQNGWSSYLRISKIWSSIMASKNIFFMSLKINVASYSRIIKPVYNIFGINCFRNFNLIMTLLKAYFSKKNLQRLGSSNGYYRGNGGREYVNQNHGSIKYFDNSYNCKTFAGYSFQFKILWNHVEHPQMQLNVFQ